MGPVTHLVRRASLVLLAAGAALAQVEQAPRTHYRGREIARTMHASGAEWLVRESREREEAGAALLRALDVREGDRVCDLGCGNGYHTLPLAELVGESGRVLAVDVQPEMLTMLEERAREAGLGERIERVLAGESDPRLPEGELDLVLMVDVYHELSYPEEVLRAVRRSLAPGGRMVLVEFREEDPEVPIKPLHKMSKRQVLREVLPNGFRLVREFDELPWQHVLFFGRASGDELARGVRDDLASACGAMRELAVHGGYAGIEMLGTGERYGESFAHRLGPAEILVQPHGTSSVGAALLRAFRATGEDPYLEAARAAGRALAWAQSAAGGWDRTAVVAHLGPGDAAPPRGMGRGSFDDGTSQEALRFLIELDLLLDEAWVAESAELGIAHHLRAQRADGGWPQWFPLRGGYRDLATFNDGAINDCIDVLLLAADRYGREDCLAAALRGADFIRASQLPPPRAGWAQQYTDELDPAPARPFEPAAVCAAVTARNVRTLLMLHARTGDARYLATLPAAIEWLESARLADGDWARFYDLETGRPIYADRDGSIHTDVGEISQERREGYSWHGRWGIPGTLRAARAALAREAADEPPAPYPGPRSRPEIEMEARAARAALGEDGFWTRDGAVHAEDFARHVGAMCELLETRE